MKKFLCLALTVIMLIGIVPVGVLAADTTFDSSIIHFEDGTYMEVTIGEASTRATNTKTGYKKYTFRNNKDEILWEATLSATFTYNGTSSSCTSGSCSVSISNNNWYVVSNSTTRSGNTATTHLTMGKKFLGITIDKPEYTITLTCDKNGNLS